MNKQLILDALWSQCFVSECGGSLRLRYNTYGTDLKQQLELCHRPPNSSLPRRVPRRSRDAVPYLREYYSDCVEPISLVLNHHFPRQFIFYRKSPLEKEMFEALRFFSDVEPCFNLGFKSIDHSDFDRYLHLNAAVIECCRRHHPLGRTKKYGMTEFLFNILAQILVNKSSSRRFWVCSTSVQDSFERQVWTWSGCPGMAAGDAVFMYHTGGGNGYLSRPKELVGLWVVVEDSWFHPWWKWPFAVEIEFMAELEGLSFDRMRKDPVLQKWSVIRRQFQGVTTEEVPREVCSRLLELLPEKLREQCVPMMD